MRPCTVCVHPELEQIDLLLLTGTSIRKVCTKFGLSIGAVQRHSHAHVHLPERIGGYHAPSKSAVPFSSDADQQSPEPLSPSHPARQGITQAGRQNQAKRRRQKIARAAINLHERTDNAMRQLETEEAWSKAADASRHVRACLDQVAKYTGVEHEPIAGLTHLVGMSPAQQLDGLTNAMLQGLITAEQAKVLGGVISQSASASDQQAWRQWIALTQAGVDPLAAAAQITNNPRLLEQATGDGALIDGKLTATRDEYDD